jgi:D-alanyl-D-alanine carboxypeptidase
MKRVVTAVALTLLVAGSVAACASDDAPGDPASADQPGSTAPLAAPDGEAAAGVITGSDPRAQQVVDIVEDAIGELELQSIVFGVWVGDEEVARGAVDAPSAQPATAIDAKVRVGQPMEAMLGTVLLQMASEDLIGLDDPVEQYVPDLVNADRITPRMLANSTGGTPDYVTDEAFGERVQANPFAGYSFDELLGYAQQTPPLFEPGSDWAYSHTEMAVLVEVLEAASGQSLHDLMAERIFGPLDMDDSSAHQDNAITEPVFHAFTTSRGVFEDSTYWDPTWGFNGGMNASVADLGTWLRALNTGALLEDADAAAALAPPTPGLGGMTDERYFSYGSLVGGDWILGNPSLNGYMGFTAQQRDPSVTIVVWSTGGPAYTADDNASMTISQRIAEIVGEEPIDLS